MTAESWVVAAGLVVGVLVVRRLLGGARAPRELLAQRIREGATVVDVRSPGEFAVGAFPGAINIPLGGIRSRLREIPKDGAVVVYCASGIRSASAARVLRRAGYAEVLNAGGLRHMPS